MNERTSAPGPLVACPACGREIRYDASSPFRPFCSERCRVMDFGGWANERYRIPERSAPQADPDQDAD